MWALKVKRAVIVTLNKLAFFRRRQENEEGKKMSSLFTVKEPFTFSYSMLGRCIKTRRQPPRSELSSSLETAHFAAENKKNTLNQSGQLVVITFFWWEIKLLAAHFLYRTNSITPGMKMRSVSGHVRLMWPHPELTLCSGVNAIFTTEAGVCTRRDDDKDICRKSNKRLSANIWSYVDSVPLEHQTEDALFCRPCEE